MLSARILMISPYSNWPGDSGGRIRSGMIAKGLAEFAEVRILNLYHDKPLQTPPGIDEIVMRPDFYPRIWSLRTDEHPLAPMVPAMIVHRVNRHIKEFAPDIILFEETITTGILGFLETGDAKTVFSTQNVDSKLLSEAGRVSKRKLENARNDEMNAINNTDYLMACSDLDAQDFKQLSGKSAFVLNNPIPDESCFDLPITPDRYKKPGFIFIGSLGYQPNIEAFLNITDKIMPRMPKTIEATIVGREANRFQRHVQKDSRIHLHSDVPDTLSFLAQFGQSLMPIDTGGGTRLKVLEAMAAGVVVVATEKAVEGIDIVPDQHFRLAHTPKQFVEVFMDNIANERKSENLAITAREFVRKHFSSANFNKKLRDIVTTILSDDVPPPRGMRKDYRDRQHKPTPKDSTNLTSPSITKRSKTIGKIKIEPCLIGTFHKTGTVLFQNILRDLSKQHGVEVWNSGQSADAPAHWDIMFEWSSAFSNFGIDPAKYPTLIVIRDPRDVVISSAHYHMKSAEAWLHIPKEKFEGRTYQEQINSLADMRARYLFEMDHKAGAVIREMVKRKQDPAYSQALFVTLESLVSDVDLVTYRKLFTHLGFDQHSLQAALDCALKNSVFAGKHNQHVRDPRPKQWLKIFDAELNSEFQERFGNSAKLLGYDES